MSNINIRNNNRIREIIAGDNNNINLNRNIFCQKEKLLGHVLKTVWKFIKIKLLNKWGFK